MFPLKIFFRKMRSFSAVTTIILFILTSYSSWSFSQNKNIGEIRRSTEREYLSESEKKTERHSGDFTVKVGEVIDANIVITEGDIKINGDVLGSVIVIDGDIRVNSRGTIRGDAIAISGDIIRNSGGVIVGDEIETSWRNFVQRSDKTGRRWTIQWDAVRDYGLGDEIFGDDETVFRYNRVEGLFLGIPIAGRDSFNDRMFNLYGNVGYGFKSGEWRYTVGFEKRFFMNNMLSLGIRGYDLTDSDDFWRLKPSENTLAALFLKEDFFDFYSRTGMTAYVNQEILNSAFVMIEYRADIYESMKNETNWSFFGGGKIFRLNPPIDEGKLRSINVFGLVDTKNNYRIADKGWWLLLNGEYTNPDLGGDFDYERYIFDIRRFHPLSFYENLNIRLLLGSSRGVLPLQRRFYLGGLSTLRGMRYKEFSGSSVFLANIEYLFDPERILAGPPSWFLEDFKIALFIDVGAVTEAHVSKYIDALKDKKFKHNVGIGITTHKEDFRIDFAWRTDIKNQPLRVTFRLSRSF